MDVLRWMAEFMCIRFISIYFKIDRVSILQMLEYNDLKVANSLSTWIKWE
jgi:hypothetical protein